MIGALALAVALVAAPAACTVDDATLDWGFKESFRSYISGSIANGEWTVADGATYSTPTFGFTGGSGSLTDGVGTIAFPGSIEFTGHGGALDTTVANPQLRFDGSATAILLLDVAGTTQEGSQVAETAVPFATVDLAGGVADDGHYRLDAAPTELTAEGAAAFGTYAAGDALDPVTLDLPVRVPCAPGQDGAEALVLLVVGAGIALLVGLLVVGALVTVVLLVRRTRRASLDLE